MKKTETVAAQATPKTKQRKPLWITVAAVAGVLVVGGIAAPVVIGNVHHAQASNAFVSSEDAAAAAAKDLAKAEAELAAAKLLAAEQYTAAKALADVTAVERIADEAVLVEYKDLLAAYAEAAELQLDENLNVVVAEATEEEPAVKPAPVKTPESTDALNDGADKFQAQADKDVKSAKALRAEVKAIETAYEPIPDAQLVVVESAHVKGTELAGAFPAHATQESKDAFNAAVAAIAADALTDESDLAALVKTYVDAWAAVEASHAAEEARIAAEQAAAEEAARQQQNSGGRKGDGNRGGHPGNGSGGSGGGGGNPGSGGGEANPGTGSGTPSVAPRGQILYTGAACQGSGSSASGNWITDLVAPKNATSVWVAFENPGSGWGIAWSCMSGDW